MAAKITGGGCPWQRFYRKRTPSRVLLFSVRSSHSMDTVYKQLGLFSLKKKIKDVVLKAEMLAPNVLELEEEQWIKQEEKMPYYDLWDDPTKTYEILLKLADSLKDLKYKDEEAKLIIQLGEIDYSLFEQSYDSSYDVSRSLHHYEMLKLLNYLYDVEGACVIIKSGSQDTKSQVNFTIIKIWTEQVVSLYIKCAEKQAELKDEDMIVSYPAKENHKLAAGERNRFPSQLIAFSRHKRPFLLRATPTSTTVEVSDAVSGAPSKLISQTRSTEWWIDSLRSKVRSNFLREAILTYIDMISLGIKPDNFAFPALLKAVADLEDMDLGKQIHAHVHKFGYGVDSVTVANTLVNLYRKCGDFGAVYKVFDRISDRNQVSWNSMISSLCSFEKWEMALEAFRCMLDENVDPSSFTLVSVALACSNLPVPEGLMLGMQVHAYSLRKGDLNSYIVNTLVAMYGKLGKLASSKILLGTFEGRDLVTWNTVLSSLCQNEQFLEALEYLREMVLKGVEPDGFTISGVLPVCSHLEMLRTGKEIHAYALKNGSLDENSFVGSALVDMYCNCKQVLSGRRVFDGIFDRKIGLWNAMITGYAQNEHDEEALALFIEMEESAGLLANTTTMASVVPACVRSNAFSRKEAIHGFVTKRGLGGDRFVQNALMDMYSRLGKIDIAEMIFGKMEDRDLVTWNTMITGYVFSESHEVALRLLHKMQNFERKANEGVTRVGLQPNSITLMTILPSCAALSALAKGKEIHAYAIKNNLSTDVAVGSALVDMYAKCGCLHMSRKVFDRISNKNVITWNVIIMAYGMHGNGPDAIDLLKMMMVQKVKPNEVTIISVFAACSHSGMVDEGLRIFYNMKKDYGVEPSSDHFACVVDLFGRAGRVKEAYQLMNLMPLDIDKAGAWSSLLGACRIHNNLEIGEIAAQNLIQLEPNVASHYVLLANMYSSAGLWDKAKEARRKMKEKGVRKEPGCSWIEYGDEIHKFIAGDSSHPQSEKLHGYLESLWEKMRKEGYVPDTSCVLHNVEEDEKEVLLCGHSEKLAIAFGILNTSPGSVIRVAKNLRVCNDCHLATKFISKIVDREIILRDVRRFHHFKNGTCSCGDYW